MRVNVRFFAQLRDLTRVEGIALNLADGASASDLLEQLYANYPALRAHDKTILLGVGVEFVDRNYRIKAGDEVAIMPPVQGG